MRQKCPGRAVAELAAGLGMALDRQAIDRLDTFATIIRRWNRAYDLVANDGLDALVWHFGDSLAHALPLGLVEQPALRLADLGSGAGLPGMVLAIVFPETHVALIESLGKRAQFLDEAAADLGLEQVEVWGCRAEEAGRSEDLRASFDRVTARRLAAMPVLLEYSLPLLKIGGRAVFAKGVGSEQELADGQGVAPQLGGGEPEMVDIEVPLEPPSGELPVRRFVVVEQVAACDPKYPRAPGRPTKRPLTGGGPA